MSWQAWWYNLLSLPEQFLAGLALPALIILYLTRPSVEELFYPRLQAFEPVFPPPSKNQDA